MPSWAGGGGAPPFAARPGRHAETAAAVDDPLLGQRYAGHVDLDPQVAPRDHDPIADADDVVELVERLGLFDLGDDLRSDAALFQLRTEPQHVVGPAHEAQAHEIDVMAGGPVQVVKVLVRQGTELETRPRGCHALLGAEFAG
mgnify:CR=1 FL=1